MIGNKKEFLTPNHLSTPRDYQSRATNEKPRLSAIAKKFEYDYWDGARTTGYGGYKNDGRWKSIVERISQSYQMQPNDSVLDIGCGKGYLLLEFKKRWPQMHVHGVDISEYALQNAPPEIQEFLSLGKAQEISLPSRSFDLVVSMNTLHNLELPDLISALKHIQRISKKNAYICVESYRTEEEKWNLMRWQLTCECFYTPKEWEYIFELAGYRGDYEFIFFE